MVRLITFVAVLGFFIWNPFPLQILELKTFDYIMNSQPEIQNDNILIVDIDEAIVEAYGGYPLPRKLYGQMIESDKYNK